MIAFGDFEIVPLRAENAEALAALHRQVMNEPDGWSDAGLRRLLTAQAARGFQAEAGGAIAGYVLAFAAADEAEVLALCVAQEHRGKGLAQALLRDLARELTAGHIVRLHLEVRASNLPARRLYARIGFIETGRRKGYYSGVEGEPAEDAITMLWELVRSSSSAI